MFQNADDGSFKHGAGVVLRTDCGGQIVDCCDCSLTLLDVLSVLTLLMETSVGATQASDNLQLGILNRARLFIPFKQDCPVIAFFILSANPCQVREIFY